MYKIFTDEDQVQFKLDQNVVEQWTHKIRLMLQRLADDNINMIYERVRGRIQSALYAFEDCQSVIDDYKELEYFDVKNAGYLKLYGLLQAMFVQQDAINNLRIAFFNTNINFSENHKELYHLRRVRNKTIGHPTNKGGEYYLISQMTLNKYGYQIICYKKNEEVETEFIDIYKLIKNQDRGISQLMAITEEEISSL